MKSNIPYKFLIAASVVLSLTFCSLQSKHQSVPVLTPKEQQHIIKETQCIRIALYHEARGEPIEGIKAVLSVIQNRKQHKNYPNIFCGVIYQAHQFSFFNTIKHSRMSFKSHENKIKDTIAEIAFDAATGKFNSIIGNDYLFFHAVNLKKTFKWNSADKFKVRIGKHIFIKFKENTL